MRRNLEGIFILEYKAKDYKCDMCEGTCKTNHVIPDYKVAELADEGKLEIVEVIPGDKYMFVVRVKK